MERIVLPSEVALGDLNSSSKGSKEMEPEIAFTGHDSLSALKNSANLLVNRPWVAPGPTGGPREQYESA